MKQNYRKIRSIGGLLTLIIMVVSSCNKEDQSGNSTGEAVISLSVRAASTSINEDQVLWEDRVDEIRMLVFDPADGSLVYNEILYFPDGFTEPSRAVRLPVGTYNFYFIANETVYSDNFVTALLEINNQSEFSTDSRFTTLAYNPQFLPDQTSEEGRFVMSAIYNEVTVTGGGTETNPAPLLLSTGKVELIRAMAKVEVVFRKKVSGSTIPENTITSVLMENVAAYLSVPPADSYYEGATVSSPEGDLTGLDYSRDSIGAVTFYIPEFLVSDTSTEYTLLEINNQSYPMENDTNLSGITDQRRTVPTLSTRSVIRNYHYIANVYIDADGGLQLRTHVEEWQKDSYTYLFQGDMQLVIPPVIPTDSSIIIPTECGKVEILSQNENLTQGLQGAYNDVVNYWDAELQGPTIYRGDPPYYCEKKYGEGWRLINSCELLSYLAICDAAYNIWLSNTWLAASSNMPYYPLTFRKQAQTLLEELTGEDLSGNVLYNVNNWEDQIDDVKLNLVDRYFTPGDILLRLMDFPDGWPFTASPNTSEDWFYIEVTIQVKAFWYDSGYITLTDRSNWDKVLYGEFERYDYSSTVSRCVRTVD